MDRAQHRHQWSGRTLRSRGTIAILAAMASAVGGLLLIPAAPALAAPCTEPQNLPADPANWGGFEIDANLCLNTTGTTGTLDWDTVAGPQPVATDLVGSGDLSAFTGGADESNGPNWSVTQTTNSSGIPSGQARSDIGNVYASSQVVGEDVFAYVGFELQGGTGTASLHMELNQKPNNDPSCPRGNRGVPSPCRTVGDLLLGFDKSGGGPITLAQTWTWNGSAWVVMANPAGVAVGRANLAAVTSLDNRTLIAGRFGEVAVNLTTLFGPVGCSGSFGTLNMRTSASTTLTSGLIDWVRPIDLSVPSTCPTVVLQKRWVNGAVSDTAGLSVNGATTGRGSATSTVTALTGTTFTDTTNRATADVEPGSVVNLAEVLGTGNLGTYTSTIGCDNGFITPPVPGRSASFTMPAGADASTTITCTFVNTRTQATLSFTKVWQSSTPGDTAGLTIQSGPRTTGPTTSTAPTGTAITATVFSGEDVTVLETLGNANTSSYDATTACGGNVVDFSEGDFGAEFTVPDQPTAIACTITNTAIPARLTLSKQWVRGAPSDSTELTITSPTDSDSAVATVPAGLTGRSTSSASLPIVAGQTVTLDETLPAPNSTNTGTYTRTSLTCNGQAVTFQPTASGATAEFTVPSSAPVSCVYTNTRQQARVVLQKGWVNAALGDAAHLFILGGPVSRILITSTATQPTFTDNLNQNVATVLTGNRITLTEGLADGNVGGYDAGLSCDPATVVPDATGSFVVTGDLAGTTVTCTVTNTRTTGTVRLHKVWRDGVPGDTAHLTISSATSTGDATSTVPRPAPPVFDDSGHAAVATIDSGETITVAEVLGQDNTGSYGSQLVCDNGISGSRSVTFTVGADPGSIGCTVTNTVQPVRPPAHRGTPRLHTHTSDDRVTPGQLFHDRVQVRGLLGSQGATATAQLFGPFASRSAVACRDARLAKSVTWQVHNGANRSPGVKIHAPGVYTWRVTVGANAANESATHSCGLASETTVVAKPRYVAPAVAAGFSGTLLAPDPARDAPPVIRMPAIGLDAPVHTAGVTAGRMDLPGDVSDVGWLRKSAGVGDKIGTTVIAGHVSDRHDIPGAMFHLAQAHRGQRVAVTQSGHTYRFDVVATATFPRGQRLPHRYFKTVGHHRLVLISCTDRVVFPNGHFHYTRYQVVVADPV
jgi:hypothetical protein